VADALSNASIECVSRSINRIPNNTVDLDGDGTRKVLKFMDALDDHDDVQNVSANFNITPEVMEELDL
jgi:transcriptional/translational regulatory protein YebC/TACO1